jgi:hypothetical protein
MKLDKKIRITVLDYVKIGNNDTLMYVINADGDKEFRYIWGASKTLKLKSTSPTRFFEALKKLKDMNQYTRREVIIWMHELGTSYVFPEEAYLEYNKEVSEIASREQKQAL